MSPLLDHRGMPMAQSYTKATPPKAMGEAFGLNWGGPNGNYRAMPGGQVLQFNLNRLTLADFRSMRDHYQVNISLAVLTFVMHQLDWHIESENKTIQAHCQANMEHVWSQLVRGMSQAFWAGFSPNVLQWDNDSFSKSVQLTKVKDLVPEDSAVHWDYVDGYVDPTAIGQVPPKIPIYDGIKYRSWQPGNSYSYGNTRTQYVPPENSMWYPLLMENGDMYGRKLLRAAFTPWYFSNLVHLFSNRYFERFGEPLPVGRAPYEEEITVGGVTRPGNEVMLDILQQMRARNVVVLPNDRTGPQSGETGAAEWDYSVQYLESQMRGADFDRYLTRLDEEITLALFTPLLVTRTADVGSYSLGNAHMLTYNIMLNALAGDWKTYLDQFVLSRMVDYNFGVNAPRARIVFRKLGRAENEMMRTLMSALVNQNKINIDVESLGEMTGLKISEVKEVIQPVVDPNAPGGDPSSTPPAGDPASSAHEIGKLIKQRVIKQAEHGFKNGSLRVATFDPGYQRRLADAITGDGDTDSKVNEMFERITSWLEDSPTAGFTDAKQFANSWEKVMDYEVGELVTTGASS